MPTDEKKPDPNQEQEFEEWDREHRGPVISPDEQELLQNELRFQRIASETLKAFYDKHRQEAFAVEVAAINAKLDAEFGQVRGGREKDAAIIPPRSLEPTSAATPMSRPLSKRLQRGKDCEEMADEIKTIRAEAISDGKAMVEIRKAHPGFRVWTAAQGLLPEDRAVFETPARWGAASGYANLFLSKLFPPRTPATVNDWRKQFRAYKKQNLT